MGSTVPEWFASIGPEIEGELPIVIRPALDDEARRILDAISSVEWPTLEHAYGAADEVGNQLAAVTVGDEHTRELAWWNLWGNIHHQGTVYSATAPAVPILRALAEWRDFPDRDQAISFLTEVGRAANIGPMPGSHGGVYAADRQAAEALALSLRTSVEEATTTLMRRWESEGQVIRRHLLLLIAVQPSCRSRYDELVEPDIPQRLRGAWREYEAWPDSEEGEERREELEEWAYGAS